MFMLHFTGGKPPQRVLFVDLLTKLICENIPDFWRLGQSYLSGKLLKEVRMLDEKHNLRNDCV